MTAAVIPFRPRQDASLADIQAQLQRETARLEAEVRAALEEAERIRAGYIERQARIEVLLAGIHADVERA